MSDQNSPQGGQGGQPPQYGAPQGGQPQDGQPQYGAPQGGQPQYGAPQYGQGQGGPGYYAPAPVVRPPTIDKAVLMMKIGAGLAVVSAIASITMKGALRDSVSKSMKDAGGSMSASDIDSFTNLLLVGSVFFGLVGAVLWWWMAVMNGKGKSWARIVATVFFGISVLSFLMSFSQPSGGVITMLLSVIMVAVGAAAIFFMYQKDSSRFYEESSRVR